MVNHHGGDLSIDDLLLAVEVEHVNGRHLGGRAAGPSCTPWVSLVHQVCMWVLLQVQELTLPRAVVCSVAFGRDNPVPTELLKVNGEWVSTAACLHRLFITVEARITTGSLEVVENLDLDEGLLGRSCKWKIKQ